MGTGAQTEAAGDVHLDSRGGSDPDVRERVSRTLSSEAAAADASVRRLEGHDPCRYRSSHAAPGAGPRHPCRQHLCVLRDAKVRTRNHGVAGAAGRSGARGIWSRSQASPRPDETSAYAKLRPLLAGRGRRPYATQSRGRSRPLASRSRTRSARSIPRRRLRRMHSPRPRPISR